MGSDRWAPSYAFDPHRTSREELAGLVAQADRLLTDAGIRGVSVETRHAVTHNAVILLAKAALAAYGYRTGENHHYNGIESLRHTIDLDDDRVERLHAHRTKRHGTSYESDALISEADAADLLELALELRSHVIAYLAQHHPELWPTNPA